MPTTWVLVPEAPSNLDRKPVPCKHNIGRAREITAAESVSEAEAEQRRAKQEFRLGVAAADARHVLGALFRAYSVGHYKLAPGWPLWKPVSRQYLAHLFLGELADREFVLLVTQQATRKS